MKCPEQNRLNLGQKIEIAVQIAPARLHHTHFRIGEMMDGARQEIRRQNEFGVEDRDQLAGGRFQPFVQRPGLEALAIRPVQIVDPMPHVAIALAQRLGELMRVVGRIVQHLDLQQLGRILDLHHLVDQPLQNVAFVIKGQLNRNRRQLFEAQRRFGSGAAYDA